MKITKIQPLPLPPPPTFALELTQEELVMLCAIHGNIATSASKYGEFSYNLFDKLQDFMTDNDIEEDENTHIFKSTPMMT